ncbi:hypothetical protein [Cognatishimia sp. F0-27]|uniref:hypothetical protein n=1 Tax=Cognatishimia sp. F0-27 TaxID=2816855 RepID=UPI001D0CAD13|nr:hypothetical protein [Cognatishimia sp. F0-27]MCC1492700.1 hypothetical protein [Cognatishimia sp. F0-27]
MLKSVVTLVVVGSLVAGCASVRDSRMNPFNWFGNSRSEPVAQDPDVNPLIPQRRAGFFQASRPEAYAGTMIEEISELRVERRPGGAIVTATGISALQGPFDVRLVRVDDETTETTLTYEMRRLQQRGRAGSPLSRSVTAAVWLTDNELNGINTIRVKGTQNIRNVRR